jgi:hypothetical protein
MRMIEQMVVKNPKKKNATRRVLSRVKFRRGKRTVKGRENATKSQSIVTPAVP